MSARATRFGAGRESSFAALIALLVRHDPSRRIVVTSGPSDAAAARRVHGRRRGASLVRTPCARSGHWRSGPRRTACADRPRGGIHWGRQRAAAYRGDDADADCRTAGTDAGRAIDARGATRSGSRKQSTPANSRAGRAASAMRAGRFPLPDRHHPGAGRGGGRTGAASRCSHGSTDANHAANQGTAGMSSTTMSVTGAATEVTARASHVLAAPRLRRGAADLDCRRQRAAGADVRLLGRRARAGQSAAGRCRASSCRSSPTPRSTLVSSAFSLRSAHQLHRRQAARAVRHRADGLPTSRAAGARRTVIDVIVSVGAASAAYGIIQYARAALRQPRTAARRRADALHDLFGPADAGGLRGAARLVFGSRDRVWPALVMPALIVALALTLTRSAWIGASVAVAIAVPAEGRPADGAGAVLRWPRCSSSRRPRSPTA